MKNLLSILLLSYFINISAQTDNISIIYSVDLAVNDESKLDKMFMESFGDFSKTAKEFEFELIFNKEKSFFNLIEKVYINEDLSNYALLKSSYFGRTSQSKNKIYTEYDTDLFPKKVIVSNDVMKWKLENETKTINKYICYKATTQLVVINTAGTFTNEIEAWYCPEISFPYGPAGYGGLPGLIFELKIKDAVYGITKINFDKKTQDIPNLKNLPIVTKEEFNNQAKKIGDEVLKQ